MADSFLVLVPHKTLHGTISILIQRPKLATNVGKMGAVKNKMPFTMTKDLWQEKGANAAYRAPAPGGDSLRSAAKHHDIQLDRLGGNVRSDLGMPGHLWI